MVYDEQGVKKCVKAESRLCFTSWLCAVAACVFVCCVVHMATAASTPAIDTHTHIVSKRCLPALLTDGGALHA